MVYHKQSPSEVRVIWKLRERSKTIKITTRFQRGSDYVKEHNGNIL